jgi:hypothetical protein
VRFAIDSCGAAAFLGGPAVRAASGGISCHRIATQRGCEQQEELDWLTTATFLSSLGS